jgi:hypothetical protein
MEEQCKRLLLADNGLTAIVFTSRHWARARRIKQNSTNPKVVLTMLYYIDLNGLTQLLNGMTLRRFTDDA